jgi:hypothetical protein
MVDHRVGTADDQQRQRRPCDEQKRHRVRPSVRQRWFFLSSNVTGG